MTEFSFYMQLLLIFTLAVGVSLGLEKCKKIAIPIVVGDIIVGIIFGKSGFGLLGSGEEINFIADIGFAILMFLSGLEVDLSMIKRDKSGGKKKWWDKPVVMAWLIFGGSLFGGLLCTYILIVAGIRVDLIMMTLLLSTTSLGVVVPVLKEKEMLQSTFGQTLLVAALIADVATMLLITLYISWCNTGNLLPCALVAVLFLVFALVTLVGRKAMHIQILHGIKDGTGQIMVKISFFLLFVFICLAEKLGIEIILGAFIAGLVISIISKEGTFRIREKMDIIGYGFFIPIFFINIGATFDLSTVLHNKQALLLIPVLLVISFAIKLIPALLLKANNSWRSSLSAGMLLSSRLSLIIAAGAIALKMNLITEAVNGSLLLVAILTCTIAPLLFNKIYKDDSLGIAPQKLEEISKAIIKEH